MGHRSSGSQAHPTAAQCWPSYRNLCLLPSWLVSETALGACTVERVSKPCAMHTGRGLADVSRREANITDEYQETHPCSLQRRLCHLLLSVDETQASGAGACESRTCFVYASIHESKHHNCTDFVSCKRCRCGPGTAKEDTASALLNRFRFQDNVHVKTSHRGEPAQNNRYILW